MGNRSNKPPFTRRPEDWFSQVRSSEAITSDVDAVLAARFINTTAPITGGGSLAADRTLVLNGTKAEFNAACSDGDFLFVGDIAAYTDEQARDAIGAALVAGTNITITVNDAGDTITIDATGGGSLADGDYGDVTVGGGGTTLTLDNNVVTYAKMQDISATARILGRKTAAAGDVEECTLSEILDFIGSAAHGDVLYRDSGDWQRLPPGTAGQLLQTNGAGADPTWVTPQIPMLHFSWFNDITVGFTFNINSTSYISLLPLFAWFDGDDFPATHYRLIARGQSNAAGATVSFQLTRGGSAVHTGGNDLLFTSAANQTVDTGWRTVDISLAGLSQLIIQGKGSTATVDFVGPSPWDLYLKIDP